MVAIRPAVPKRYWMTRMPKIAASQYQVLNCVFLVN
jgi:hypothetical protein